MKNRKITYLGINNLFKHKRGVENVIDFQSQANSQCNNYYIHWDDKTYVYRYEKLICIAVKKNFLWTIVLNIILFKIKKRDKSLFIHSHNPLMSIVSIYQSQLLTVHDALYYLTKSNHHPLKNLFYLLEKLLYTRVSFVHFISNYAKNESLFPKASKKFITMPNTSHFERMVEKASIKGASFFDALKYKILVVRSIEERARIDLLIEFMATFQNKNIEILVAGKGPFLDFYRDDIKRKGVKGIQLLGYVSDQDLLQLYEECNLVLMPAEYGEGFGLPIIEGYFFDKPVIASNKCAIPDIIYSSDYLFENTVESISERIDFVQNNLIQDFKSYYNLTFSNKIVLDNLYRLYNALN